MSVGRACIESLVVISLCLFSGCRHDPSAIAAALQHTLASQTPTPIGAALQHVVTGKPPTPLAAVWADVRAFYAARQDEPAWVTNRSVARAETALQVLRSAPAHGFSAADYDETNLSADLNALKSGDDDQSDRVQRLAELDARITTALFALGHDVALGRTTPTSIDPHWKPRRKAPDFVGMLTRAAEGDPATWLDAVRPPHPEYAALQHAVIDLHEQEGKGGWPTVPTGHFKLGESDPSVVVLRQRLSASGELSRTGAVSASPLYDEEIDAAVRSFQDHHAIKATGIVDAQTLAAMNVSLENRLAQAETNLERWRWMPDDFGPRHFLVNIPSFMLMARENGKTVMDIRVVVGKPDHETPIFSGEMSNVVFSPYWNVPESIAEGETAPAAAVDPGYIERNNMEIFRVSKSGTARVDEADVDWSNPAELKKLMFRQRPGRGNALGHVKFLFPNPFNVYLHDTPADSLFARPRRAFSHGCVRVEEPEALAKYVLRGYSEWDEPRILKAMNSGVEKYVKLNETIPVHIVYFTVWVDDGGGVHFQPDVYGYDTKQMTESTLSN